MATNKKDLPVRKDVKAGVGSADGPKPPSKLAVNDNLTLVRG